MTLSRSTELFMSPLHGGPSSLLILTPLGLLIVFLHCTTIMIEEWKAEIHLSRIAEEVEVLSNSFSFFFFVSDKEKMVHS